MEFSIIIPAFNEEEHLPLALAGVAGLITDKQQFEVIVIDNGSIDQTVEIAKRMQAKVIVTERTTPGNARNIGVKQSTGRIIAFLDSDCVPAEDWLDQGRSSLLQERCITGAEYLPGPDATWVEEAWCSQRPEGRYPTTHVGAGNMFILRTDFDLIGGFDPKLETGEDFEMCHRAKERHGIPMVHESKIVVTHLGNPKTIAQFFKRELWHGKSALATVENPLKNKPLVASLIFTAALTALAISIPLLSILCIPFALVTIALPMSAVFHRMRAGAKLKSPFRLAFLYGLYFLARTAALFKTYFRIM